MFLMGTYQQLYLVYKSKKSVYGASDFFGIDKTVKLQLELVIFNLLYNGTGEIFWKKTDVYYCAFHSFYRIKYKVFQNHFRVDL